MKSETAPDVTPTIVNALIGAAADPEPIVRGAAVNALGQIANRERALPPSSRGSSILRAWSGQRPPRSSPSSARRSAGAAGDALRRAQADYSSVLYVSDVASNHAAKGWLEAERGNVMVARDALNKATAVAPNYAFPWVIKGVLSAREGKFADAVEMLKRARSIEPSYPNIDQLIAEAEKRK